MTNKLSLHFGARPSVRIPFRPVRTRDRHDGWTLARQRAFIAALADLGSVSRAAASVGISARSAYRLKRRDDAASFSKAWDRALDHACARRIEEQRVQAEWRRSKPYFYGNLQRGVLPNDDSAALLRRLDRLEKCLAGRSGSSTGENV
ncbi:hypothetical protein [Novosphingopyxis iocasae]|uniref:hypothetical protein n=1 Tax=Novosphingopyxis iocasae TaxID=2762729 RepID=UPI0016516A06|nr:hypothetical protein [Novosphingopyxis iocasae]